MQRKTIVIAYNDQKAHVVELAEQISSYVSGQGYEYFSFPRKKLEKGANINAENLFLIISIGGDGTVLSLARNFPNIPILALNAGSVGFITETPMSDWREAFDDFCGGAAKISSRLMLHARIYREDQMVFDQIGLNEIVISAEGIARLVDLFVQVDEDAVGRFRADGVLVSTSTGSTAYSAAAGGPVLSPEMEAFIINPICPFSLSGRPIVVNGDRKIYILVEPNQRTSLNVTVDGQVEFGLQPLDRIFIQKAIYKCQIVQCKNRNFFEVLREKLHWSGGSI